MRNRAVFKWGLIAATWTLFGLFFASEVLLSRSNTPNRPAVVLTSVQWLVCAYTWFALTPLVLALARRFPLERSRWRRNLVLHLCTAAIISFIHLAGYVTLAAVFGWKPPNASWLSGYQRLVMSDFHGLCLLNCEVSSGQTPMPGIVRALDDGRVIHGKVSLKSGGEEIDAYLSRPKKPGRYPMVIVVTGNSIDEKYIQNMTAMLAQESFVGFAPNIYSLQKATMTAEEKRRVFAEQITDERIFQDLNASIDYLRGQRFVNRKGAGITGFCFGGRCALMFAAKSKEINAVVPFYGNLRTPPFANRKEDPLDVLDRIKAPVQGHYAESDPEIPLEQLRVFDGSLKKQGTPVEIFTYKAPHGFFTYTRATYNADAARTSWQRTAEFFKRTSIS